MTTPEPATGSRLGRRAALRRRRRRQRLQLVGGLLALALVAAVVFAVALVRQSPESVVDLGPQERTQRTLLLQVQGLGGEAVAAALLAHDPSNGQGAGVLVPPQVLVDVAGSGSLTLAEALPSVPPEASRGAVSDLLGVTVDGGWVVTLPVLQTLVDAVGGIAVDVDTPVVSGDTLLVPEGPQRLGGTAAVAVLVYQAPGEPAQARLARQQEVVDGVLAALPGGAAEVAAVLRGLGERSIASQPLPELAALLAGLHEATVAGEVQYDLLPVVPIDTGAESITALRVDEAATEALVDRLLAQSVPPGAREEGNRVLVLNGVGTPGLGASVRERLVAADLVVVGTRNAPAFGYPRTQVLVPEVSPEARQLGERVAEAVGVPGDAVAFAEFGAIADVVVLVGADYAPDAG